MNFLIELHYILCWFASVKLFGLISHTSTNQPARQFPFISLILVGLAFSQNIYADTDPNKSVEPIYGAGPSTEIVTLFFNNFSKRPEAAEYEFWVPKRSTKHAGGIRASGQHLFGRTGRPLTKKEKGGVKFEIFLGRVPVGFVTSPTVRLPPLTPLDIKKIFSDPTQKWKDFGGPDAPVVLVGREKTEAVLTALSKYYPVLLEAQYQKILKRDHALVNFLKTPGGKHAIGYGAISNFGGLNVVELDGQQLGVKVGLVFDIENRDHPLVKAVSQFARSKEWHQMVENSNYFAVEDMKSPP